MVKQVKRKILFFFLIIFLTRSCLDPTEKDGQCTKCLSTENLQNGKCYTKIRGCFKQSALTCTQCQEGYIIDGNQCTRYAEYFNLTSLAPSLVKIQDSKLNSSQISSVLAGGFQETTNFNSPTYAQAKFTLIKEYPVLTSLKVYKVEEQIVNGVNYIFYIINTQNYDLYLAKVYVSFQLQGSVTEIYKNDASILKNSTPTQGTQPIPGAWKPFTTISDPRYNQSLDLIQKTFPGIQTYKLEKVEYQIVAGINFLFSYKGPNSESFTCQVYEPFYGPPLVRYFWGTKPVAENSKTTESQPFAGATDLMSVSDYDKEPFLSVVKTIQKVLPQFHVSQIKKVQRQIVAGWNLIVTFSLPDSLDIYDVQVFVPLAYTGNSPQIQSIKKNGTIYNPSSSNAQNSSLTITQNVGPIVGGYSTVTNMNSPFYIQAKSALFKAYPELSNFNLAKAQQQIVNGINYIFTFVNQNNGDQYVAKIYVSLSMSVTINEISKNGQITGTDGVIKDKNSTESSGGQQTIDPQSTSSSTPTTSQTETLIGGYSSPVNETHPFFIIAKSTLFKEYPFLSGYQIQKTEGQVVNGMNYLFTIVDIKTNDKYVARVYVNLQSEASVEEISKNGISIKTENQSAEILTSKTQSETPSVDDLLAGGWQTVSISEFSSEPFLSVQAAISKMYPAFSQSLIKKAVKQIVAGWNYAISFTLPNSTDLYEVKVYVPLSFTGKGPEITETKKTVISSNVTQIVPTKIEATYNYQSDPTFTQLYKYFKSQVKISNLLNVADVSRELKTLSNSSTKYYEYKITYSNDQYAICRSYPDFGLYEIVSYIADKNELYNLTSRMNTLPYSRTESVLAEKAKQYDSSRFGRLLIREINQIKLSEYYRIYKLNVFTSSGHFNITILDKGELFVIQVQQIGNQKGFLIRINDTVQYRQQYIIDQLKTYLYSKYSLSGYELTLALVNSLNASVNQYVILLARDDLKKLKVLVEQTNGTFVIKKQDFMNDGIYVVSDPLQQKSIDDQAKKDFSYDLKGFDSILVQTNGTLNVARYANDLSVSTYTNNTLTKTCDLKNKMFLQSQKCQTSKNGNICTKCSESDFLWRGKCYTKILNCAFQVGSECLACNKCSIDIKGKCINDYSVDIFA